MKKNANARDFERVTATEIDMNDYINVVAVFEILMVRMRPYRLRYASGGIRCPSLYIRLDQFWPVAIVTLSFL